MNKLAEREAKLRTELAAFTKTLDLQRFLVMRARAVPALELAPRDDSLLVEGCFSRIWLALRLESGGVRLCYESESQLVKGVLSLLADIYNEQPLGEALAYDCLLFQDVKLKSLLPSSKRHGLGQVLARIKELIAAQSSP